MRGHDSDHIGAVIGAVALGAFGAALCNALQEPGEPSCLSSGLMTFFFQLFYLQYVINRYVAGPAERAV
jgi:hypothetical protein